MFSFLRGTNEEREDADRGWEYDWHHHPPYPGYKKEEDLCSQARLKFRSNRSTPLTEGVPGRMVLEGQRLKENG